MNKRNFRISPRKIQAGTKELSSISKVSKDKYRLENAKTTLSLYAFQKLLFLSKIIRPKRIKIIERYEHAKSSGKKGFLAVIKKYGKFPKNEELRKESWQKWWKTKGIHQKREIFKRKRLIYLKKASSSQNYAEF